MVTVTVRSDGSGSYEDDRGTEWVEAETIHELRSLLLGRAVARARQEGRALQVVAFDASGRSELLVSPDGSLAAIPAPMVPRSADSAEVVRVATSGDSADPAESDTYPLDEQPADPGPSPQGYGHVQPSAEPAIQETVGYGQIPGGGFSQPEPAGQVLPNERVEAAGNQVGPSPYTPVQHSHPIGPTTPSYAQPQYTQPVGPPVPEYQQPVPPQSAAPSFLSSTAASGPRPTGLRAVAARLGLKMQATDSERQQWLDERTVAQHWPGPRTIAVLNGKGGAGKTPTSILLAGFFARLGSGSVVAADGNVTRGTLGWRTEQGPHTATILDMVPEIDRLMDPSARNGDVAAFTHHQTVDQFDVLRSNPLLLSTEQKLTPSQLDGIQRVLTRYYRLIVWDTGNDEGDELWLRIVSHADQIVVATTTRADHAEAGRLLLEGLAARDERGAALARNSVVVVSQADKEERRASALVDGFAATAREVVTVPYDAAMREQWLRSDKLAPATRAAWLHAAAAVARGL
ncbi:MinD/ParA family ATP-binding protein [Actinomyces ruminis]|uniref:ATPase n=1 Tax=Actinomyces ruminis TaxID=1937003 RepID=A0ABX4MB34_9ACTO|nr:AAA family ATPase [Actinomyces ruminis]PHP52466.1 ATPase [Actinomyces ruminis]